MLYFSDKIFKSLLFTVIKMNLKSNNELLIIDPVADELVTAEVVAEGDASDTSVVSEVILFSIKSLPYTYH